MDLRTFIRGGGTRPNHDFRSLTCLHVWRALWFFKKRGREVEFENLLRDNAGTVEGVVEPEVGGEGVVGRGGDDAVFEGVAGFEAEDADGFDTDVLIRGSVDDGGIGVVGDGAGQDVGGAAAGMGDVDEGDFDGLEGAVEVEIEAGELPDAEFVVDAHDGVNFLAAVAVGFEAVARFEQFDLIGVLLRVGWSRSLRIGFLDRFLWNLLSLGEGNKDRGKETN